MTSSYDAASNRIALTGDANAWGYMTASTYDAAGRLTGLLESGHPVVQIGYDPAGRRQSLGLGFDAFPSSAAYLYDPVGRLQSLTHDLAGTSADQALTFGYNPAGQIVTRTSSSDTYASNTAVAVDRAYSVNGLNQYTGTTNGGAPGFTFQYDANGNLTSDGTDSYVYDTENRLVSASGGHTATLSYDPLGRLWQVTAPAGTTRFLYDGDRLAIEYDGSNTLLRAYAHGTGADEPLIWYEVMPGGVSRRYLHADHQGSIIAIADQSGNPIVVNAYDEWGIPNAGNKGRFGYTGQAWLTELGLWYYKARMYSPTLGRFLQTDPVGYKDQVNLYEYVGDDPLDGRDPTGLQSCPGPKDSCPDIALPQRQIREMLAAQVPRPTRGEETGGQAIQNNKTGAITYRTGAAAGRGDAGSFSHNRAPDGSHTILRSHAHIRTNYFERSARAATERTGNNAPGTDDQQAMHQGNRAVQTIGPDVTTTMFRSNRQDYLVVDSGDRSKLPDLSGQHIIVLDHDPQ